MLSIIIPVFNSEKYIEKCVDSIIKQIQNDEIEVILINDGSTDCSGTICNELSKQDNRIYYFEQNNLGVASTRNRGIQLSHGQYVMFVDSDDWIEETALCRIHDAIEKYHPDIITYEIKYIKDGHVNATERLKNAYSTDEAYVDLVLEVYREGNFASSVNKVYSRQVLRETNFPIDMVYGEDLVFNLHAFCNANSLVTIKDCLYVYNKHNNSLSTTVDKKQISDLLKLFSESSVFFDKLKVADEIKQEMLEQHYFMYLYPNMISSISKSNLLTIKEKKKAIEQICSDEYAKWLSEQNGVFFGLLKRKQYYLCMGYVLMLDLIRGVKRHA